MKYVALNVASKPSLEGYLGSAKTAAVNYDVVFYVSLPLFPPAREFSAENSLNYSFQILFSYLNGLATCRVIIQFLGNQALNAMGKNQVVDIF